MLESNQNKKAQLCLSTAPTVTCSSPAPPSPCKQVFLYRSWGNISPNDIERKIGKVPVKPIPSMYGIFTYIWLIFMVNVGKYTIHGSYGKETCIDLLFHIRSAVFPYIFLWSHSLNQSFPIFLFLWVLAKFRYQLITCTYYIPGTHLSFVFPPKQGLFQSKQGTFGFQVYIYTHTRKPNNQNLFFQDGVSPSSLHHLQTSFR